MSPLSDTELTVWLLELRQTAEAARHAAAIATGDQYTTTRLATAAETAKRREEFLRSRALVPAACTWCSAIGELCDPCRGRDPHAARALGAHIEKKEVQADAVAETERCCGESPDRPERPGAPGGR
ncbi:hypothetical protein [Sinomonas sp. P47F7]|uniref:hypothetical protein n=1 Tax=Sinomonas sp. P47F7 TaxID=3410987 RepID=UPI003BF50A05